MFIEGRDDLGFRHPADTIAYFYKLRAAKPCAVLYNFLADYLLVCCYPTPKTILAHPPRLMRLNSCCAQCIVSPAFDD